MTSRRPASITPMLADLHLHSTASDGWHDPASAIRILASSGVSVAALSDHDTYQGLEVAQAVAKSAGIGFISAVEVSTFPARENGHILGLGVDTSNAKLNDILQRNTAVWRSETAAWLEALHEEGVCEKLPEIAGIEGRSSSAMWQSVFKLIVQGQVMTASEALASVREILNSLPTQLYEPMPSPKEVAEAIRAAGGLAVVAHPALQTKQRLVREFLPFVQGIEVYTPRHTTAQTRDFDELARSNGLFRTVGGDYHGYLHERYVPPIQHLDSECLRQIESVITWPNSS